MGAYSRTFIQGKRLISGNTCLLSPGAWLFHNCTKRSNSSRCHSRPISLNGSPPEPSSFTMNIQYQNPSNRLWHPELASIQTGTLTASNQERAAHPCGVSRSPAAVVLLPVVNVP